MAGGGARVPFGRRGGAVKGVALGCLTKGDLFSLLPPGYRCSACNKRKRWRVWGPMMKVRSRAWLAYGRERAGGLLLVIAWRLYMRRSGGVVPESVQDFMKKHRLVPPVVA